MIRLEAAQLAELHAHAREGYPEEVCGALLARPGRDGERRVVRAARVDNTREDERRRRFLIGPVAIRALEADAAHDGLELVGFYHTHPDHSAEPSAFDREHAWPWYTYLILPVAGGRPGAPRAWRLRDDRTAFDEEELVIDNRGASS